MLPILSVLTYFPLLGMIAVLLCPRNNANLVRYISVIATAVPLGLGVYLYANFDTTTASMQFVEQFDWIKPFNIQYYMGID